MALSAVSDLYEDEEFDELLLLGAVQKIQIQYTHSDCDNFAYALNQITGWEFVSVVSRSKGPLHRLVRTPEKDGSRLVDVCGFVTEADLQKRYKSKALQISSATGLIGCNLDEDDELLPVMSAMTHLPYPPFSEPILADKIEQWVNKFLSASEIGKSKPHTDCCT